ncbi:MAG: glycosyltransferase family 2 protein [Acidobacteriaceae bacterium]
MSRPGTVCVVIPCYNYGKYVKAAVESVLRQDLKVAIVIVNDGSTDEFTLQQLEGLQRAGTTVLHQVNQGLPSARNNGISVSDADYIVCLDADDTIGSRFCSSCAAILDSQPTVAFVYPTTEIIGEGSRLWSHRKFCAPLLLLDNYVPSVAMFRRRAWEHVGGYDSAFLAGYEDWDFWLSLVEGGWTGYHIDQPLFFYRQHAGSMLRRSNLQRKHLTKLLRRKHAHLYERYFSAMSIVKQPQYGALLALLGLKDLGRRLRNW